MTATSSIANKTISTTKMVAELMTKHPEICPFVERVQKEFEYFAHHSPTRFDDKNWAYLLRTTSVAARVHYFTFMSITQHKEDKERNKSEQRNQMVEQNLAEQRKIFESGGMGYGSGLHQLFRSPKIYDVRRTHQRRIMSSIRRGDLPHLLLDFQFVRDEPAEKNVNVLDQLGKTIKQNLYLPEPFPMAFINCPTQNTNVKRTLNRLSNAYPNDELSPFERDRFLSERIIPERFDGNPFHRPGERDPKKQVIYISRWAHDMLDGPLKHHAYVIPFTMDHGELSRGAAIRGKYKAMCLPLRRYIDWKSGPVYVAYPRMIQILGEVASNGGDWASTLQQFIAKRHTRTIEERIEAVRPDRYAVMMGKRQEKVEIVRTILETLGEPSEQPPPAHLVPILPRKIEQNREERRRPTENLDDYE